MNSGVPLTLVVLAAGAGSRFGGLKQLVAVGPSGETLLEYAAYDALRSGFERIVLVVRPGTEETFRRRLDDGLARRAPVAYVHQRSADVPDGFAVEEPRQKPWGTAHAVLAAADEIAGPFAVVNADDFYGHESYQSVVMFLHDHGATGRRVGVVGFPVHGTLSEAGAVSRAILRVSETGELEEVVELPEIWREDGRIVARSARGALRTLRGDELVSMNMWACPQEFLRELESRFLAFLRRSDSAGESELVLPEVVGECVRDGSFAVEVLPTSGTWFGMTFREDRRIVTAKISQLIDGGEYPLSLWA